MKIARFGLLFFAILLALSALASAHTYYGHYSVYYGSGYRPYHDYYSYGPANYYYPGYTTMGLYSPSHYYYHRYTPVNYYYYQPTYYAPRYAGWLW
jgi:hypothetical protein